jgi:hypothetical protein
MQLVPVEQQTMGSNFPYQMRLIRDACAQIHDDPRAVPDLDLQDWLLDLVPEMHPPVRKILAGAYAGLPETDAFKARLEAALEPYNVLGSLLGSVAEGAEGAQAAQSLGATAELPSAEPLEVAANLERWYGMIQRARDAVRQGQIPVATNLLGQCELELTNWRAT